MKLSLVWIPLAVLQLLPISGAAWRPPSISKTLPLRKSVRRALGYPSGTANIHDAPETKTAKSKNHQNNARATISLDKPLEFEFEPQAESQWRELRKLNAKAAVRSTQAVRPRATQSVKDRYESPVGSKMVQGATTFLKAFGMVMKESFAAVQEIEQNATNDDISKISRSGRGLFKLGKDLVGSSFSFVKNEIWKQRNESELAYSSATRPTGTTGTRPATSLWATKTTSARNNKKAATPYRPTHAADTFWGTRPVGSLGTRPVGTRPVGTRPVGTHPVLERPTISLTPVEASEFWGYTPYDSRIDRRYPNGFDYMMVHWQTLQWNAGVWLEDARCYTSIATADMMQGFSDAYVDALDAVVQFQTSAMTYEPPALPSVVVEPGMLHQMHIPAPQDYFFATTRTFPIVSDHVRKVSFVCPTPLVDPKALYFVTLL